MTTMTDFSPVLERFGVAYGDLRRDIDLPGSPERCLWRSAVEDVAGTIHVVERLSPAERARYEARTATVAALRKAGANKVVQYLESDEGYICLHGGWCWRVSRFIPGEDPPRPQYVEDEWRGIVLGRELGTLRNASNCLDTTAAMQEEAFSIANYIADLTAVIARNRPDVSSRLQPVLKALNPFLSEVDDHPKAFCHGDFHPLNVIWGTRSVEGIIDWEFCGPKHDLYDVATLVGCVGIEDPVSLVSGLVPAFLETCTEQGIITAQNGPALYGLVVSLRFAWLSEWLRKNDEEMIDLELDYMDLLLRNRDRLNSAWGFGRS